MLTTIATLGLLTQAATAPITRVVVYPDRALVTRQAAVPCGAAVLVPFPPLPPAADPASLRASTTAGSLDGLRTEERPRSESFAPRVRALEAELRGERAARAALSDEKARAEDGAQLAGRYLAVAERLAGREMSESNPNTRAWSQAFERAMEARGRAAAEVVDVDARLRKADRRIAELRRDLERLAADGAGSERRAEAVLSCPAGQTAKVSLSYVVSGAGWTPAYEARLQDSGGAGNGARVELSTYATVEQRSGEDWSAAQLTLSTAAPRQDATPPELQPLRVDMAGRAPKVRTVVSRSSYQPRSEAPADLPAARAGQGGEGGRLRAFGQGLSVQLQAQAPADVPGDGTPVRIFVGKAGLPGALRLRSAPKMAPHVFRVADLVNQAPYPLLPGTVDVLRRGQFLGRYPIERVASGERFTLTFGIEEAVKIRRTLIEEAARDRGLLGPTKRRRYGYRYDIASYLPRPEEVEIAEHVPLSEVEDIRVGVDARTSAGYQLRKEDGIVSWRLPLRPSESRQLELRYYVDVPSSYDAGD